MSLLPLPGAHTLAWRYAGIMVGSVGAFVTVRFGPSGLGDLLFAPVFGVGVLAGTLVGELTTPAPSGETRRAALRVRRARDYLPRVLGPIVAVSAFVLLVLAAVTTAVGGPELGGRMLRCTTAAGLETATGPWPGSYFTVPGLTVVVAGLVLAAAVLRRVARRPAVATEPDDEVRRHSAEAITAASGLLVLVPLLGIARFAGGGLIDLGEQCGLAWWTLAGWALLVIAGAAFLLGCWCGVLLLFPSRGVRSRTAA